MRVCIALEQRFERCPDGSVWTQSGFGSAFWSRYLDVFDGVRILARVRDVTRLDGVWHRVDGGPISCSPVPHYVGVAQFARQFFRIGAAVRAAMSPGDAYVFRVPGTIGDLTWRELRRAGYPFGLEVVGDPYDIFAPGAVRHPLRPLVRWRAVRHLTRQCRQASAVSYVTEQTLQRRYPPAGPSVAASCIALHEGELAVSPRAYRGDGPLRLVFVGSLEQYYKAPDVLIRAAAHGRQQGFDWRLTMVGAGVLQPELERLAQTFGCGGAIRFAGHLADAAAVRAELEAADLFVLPSRTEGLPRAIIEAMACGLPCIGSTAGGIPELLPAEALVPPGDVMALYQRIADLAASPERMNRLAMRNLARARDYRHDVLTLRRKEFYRHVRQATQAWLARHQPLRVERPNLKCKDVSL
jgi:glycosyltransferase involved in cell wall biosynthesis